MDDGLNLLLKKIEDWGIGLRPSLAIIALTHSSYAHENNVQSNERLEFLGDAVLELAVSEYLFGTLPAKPEGELTRYRAQLVCEPTLARCAADLGLGTALRLGRGEEAQGGRQRPALLADALEAFIGAIYLTGGLAAAKSFVQHILHPYLTGAFVRGRDFKTALQEKIQSTGQAEISYSTLEEKGPAHNRLFTVGLMVNGTLRAKGTGKNKKEAEQEAAEKLLQQLSD